MEYECDKKPRLSSELVSYSLRAAFLSIILSTALDGLLSVSVISAAMYGIVIICRKRKYNIYRKCIDLRRNFYWALLDTFSTSILAAMRTILVSISGESPNSLMACYLLLFLAFTENLQTLCEAGDYRPPRVETQPNNYQPVIYRRQRYAQAG